MDYPSRELLFSLKDQIEKIPVLILLAERGEREPSQAVKPAYAMDIPALISISRNKEHKNLGGIDGHILELQPLSLQGTTAL